MTSPEIVAAPAEYDTVKALLEHRVCEAIYYLANLCAKQCGNWNSVGLESRHCINTSVPTDSGFSVSQGNRKISLVVSARGCHLHAAIAEHAPFIPQQVWLRESFDIIVNGEGAHLYYAESKLYNTGQLADILMKKLVNAIKP